MTRTTIGILVIGFVLLTAVLLPTQVQRATAVAAQQSAQSPAPLNPLKIALLHWYVVNTTAHFPVGSQPYGLAFDGANIWSANYGDGTVSKLRAADGAVLGTFTVGFQPLGIAFDGANMWVANRGDGSITKLRASDGTVLGTFTVHDAGPYGVAFDGAKHMGDRSSYGDRASGRRQDYW